MMPRPSITDVLPGTRPDATRRNTLVVLAYGLSILVASGILGYLIGTIV